MIQAVVVAGAVSLGVSAVAAPIVLPLLIRAKSRQTISEHVPEHAAKQGTPTMGGFIMLIGAVAGWLVLPFAQVLPALLMLVGFAALGFVDDYVMPRFRPGSRGLSMGVKLLLQIGVVGAALMAAGVRDPLFLGLGGLVVLAACNAYNFADGMDGLAGSLGVLLCGALAVVAWTLDPVWTGILIALGVAFLPFLYLNAPPARVFMGDTGSMPIGAVIGLALISLPPKAGEASPLAWVVLGVASLVLVAELVPPALQIGYVKLRPGKRLLPFRTPIHHGMQHAGWPETRVVATLALAQAVCSLVALGLWLTLGPGGAK